MLDLGNFIFNMFKLFINNEYLYWITAFMLIPFTIYIIRKFFV